MIPRSVILAISALAAVALTGCGKQGALERPGPLVGPPTKPTAEEQRARAAAARALADDLHNNTTDPQAPQVDTEVRGLGLSRNLAPIPRESPVAGAPPGPDQPQNPAGDQPDPLRPASVPPE